MSHTDVSHANDRRDDPKPEDLIAAGRVDVLLSGHSHKPLICKEDGLLRVNPGHLKDEDKKGKKQQEDNPMAGMSQSMQWTMPIMFGFFALSFPAGLSIYFILSNVIGIGQGYMTRSNLAKEKAARASREEIVTTGIPASVENPRRSSASNGQPKRRKKGTKPKRKRRSAKR